MGQRGREGGLAETIAAQRLSGTSSPLGGGADAVMDRPTEEDEQRLRKALCERRSVGVRCHDSPHDEAARPCLRTFHTASPRTRVNREEAGGPLEGAPRLASPYGAVLVQMFLFVQV